MDYSSKLYRVGVIAGMFYSCSRKTNTVVVYGIGAPTVPDNGNLPDAPYFMQFGVDVFVPDYIGFGRSDGVFTPKNCIKTFLDLYKVFKSGVVGKSYYDDTEKHFKYKRVIFVGRSLSGAYIPLLPIFNNEIQELALFCPAVDQRAQGTVKGEETNEDFMRSMREDGYHHLYRGILRKEWLVHLENGDGLSPMDNIDYLSGAKLFIGHGKKDKCIHYSKSEKYYEKLLKRFPDRRGQFKLKLYDDGDHGPSTTNKAVVDFMKWLRFKKK